MPATYCNLKQWHRRPVSYYLRRGSAEGKVAFFMSADKVKFRKPVVPGDQLQIVAKLEKVRGNKLALSVECKVGDQVVSSANLMFSLIDAKDV